MAFDYSKYNDVITSSFINSMKEKNPFCQKDDDNVAMAMSEDGVEYVGIKLNIDKNPNDIKEETMECLERAKLDGVSDGKGNHIRMNSNMEPVDNVSGALGLLLSDISEAITFKQKISFPVYTKYTLENDKKVIKEMSILEFAKTELTTSNCHKSAYLNSVIVKNYGSANQWTSREQMNLNNARAMRGGVGEARNFEDSRVDLFQAPVIRSWGMRMKNKALDFVKENNPAFFGDINQFFFEGLIREYGAMEVYRIENGSNLQFDDSEPQEVEILQECPIDAQGKKNGQLIEKVITKKFNKYSLTVGQNFTGLLNAHFLQSNEVVQRNVFGQKSPYLYNDQDVIECAQKINNYIINRTMSTNIPMERPCIFMAKSLAFSWDSTLNQAFYLNGYQKATRMELFLKALNGSFQNKIAVIAVDDMSNFGAFMGNGMNDSSFRNNFSPYNARKSYIRTTTYVDDVASEPVESNNTYESQYGISVVDLSMIVNPDLGGAQMWVSKNALLANADLKSLKEGKPIEMEISDSEFVKQSPLVSTMAVFYPYTGLVYQMSNNIGYKFTFDYVNNQGVA